MGNPIASKLETVRVILARRGFHALLREIAARLSPKNRRDQKRKLADAAAFDAQGYDTGAMAFLSQLTIAGGDARDGNAYDATPSYEFEAALKMIDLDPTGVTFIDLGSGKGRILLLAAQKPFARIVGVEFAEELQTIARENLERYAKLHGSDRRIGLHTGDAGQYEFPSGPLLVFLFNPFGATTLRTVAKNLHASWRAAPRPIRIIYVNPQHSDEWLAAGFRQSGIAPDFKFALHAPA